MSSPTEASSQDLARAVNRASRRAGLAKLLSWLVAAAGVAAVALFLVQAGLFSLLTPKEPVIRPVIENPEEISAGKSTVTGIDRQNQPYEVKASHGRQDKDKPNIIYLDDIEATFRKTDGRSYTVSSLKGTYDSKLREMELNGNVRIAEDERFVANMARAHAALEKKSLEAKVPVEVSFAGGQIRANGMQITDDGARILFLNGVKARFNAETAKGDQPP